MPSKERKVCVCTSYAADREPRGPRHARAIWDSGICSQLTFVDVRTSGQPRVEVDFLTGIRQLKWISLEHPLRLARPFTWGARKLACLTARSAFSWTHLVSNAALSPHLAQLRGLLRSEKPDIIVAHNIDTLLPAYQAAKDVGAKLVFDSMEFHSDMGDEQDHLMIELIRSIESKCLPECDLILTSSEQVADALAEAYALRELLPLYNVPVTLASLPERTEPWLSLYWRNSTIGLGQRGLEEAIRALALLPEPVTLHLQGRSTPRGLEEVMQLAESVRVRQRVVVHPPYRAEEAVKQASRFHVGLCLERPGIRNHELTVSNKMFDYHMAGMAVISSDMPSLRQILNRSYGGITFQGGQYEDLARAIRRLHEDRSLYEQLSSNARNFALQEGNLDHEMAKLQAAMRDRFTHSNSREQHVAICHSK